LGIIEQDKTGIILSGMKFMRRQANKHGKTTKPMKILYWDLKLTQM
jgi:hypothetical protein